MHGGQRASDAFAAHVLECGDGVAELFGRRVAARRRRTIERVCAQHEAQRRFGEHLLDERGGRRSNQKQSEATRSSQKKSEEVRSDQKQSEMTTDLLDESDAVTLSVGHARVHPHRVPVNERG